MSRRHGSSANTFVAQYDLSGDTSSVDAGPTVDVVDVTGQGGQGSKQKLAGLKDGKVAQKGFFDDTATTGIDAVLSAMVGAAEVASFYPGGAAAASPGYAGQAELLQSYKLSSPVNGAVVLTADWEVSGGLDHVLSVEQKVTVTGSGADQLGTAQDNGASSPNGGVAVFHLFDLQAGGTVSKFELQHSADNVTYATLAASGLSAPGAARVTFAGTVNRYIKRLVNLTSGKTVTIQEGVQRL